MKSIREQDATQAERALRARNVALGLVLGFLVVLFFVMTIVRLSGHVLE